MVEESLKKCPGCMRKTLGKKMMKNGKYTWICSSCGLTRGVMKPDKKKGVV
ncbi:MAG: hypothetical protein ACMUIG_07855 [Thermoplasmatota archaeon]